MKKLAIFDIDGTIFRKNLHFELIDELSWRGIFSKDARKTLVQIYANWLEHRGTYEEYRKKNNQNLLKQQREYWSDESHRKQASHRVKTFYQQRPEARDYLSKIAKLLTVRLLINT